MKKERENRKKSGITRREFIQYSAAAGTALAIPGLLGGCSNSGSATSSSGPGLRTYYFDLSDANPAHDFYLKAAAQYVKLKVMDPWALKAARESNPFLGLVPDRNISHQATLQFQPDGICLCWIVSRDPTATDGAWDMPLLFYHTPQSALKAAAQRPSANPEPGANKLRLYGVDPSAFSGISDAYVLEDDFKTWQDLATGLVFGHQELVCGESVSAAYIQKSIIGPQPKTGMLAAILKDQGGATETGGWATQEVYINPDTGKPYLNSNGQKQYFPKWSNETLVATGGAIQPSLKQAKNDATLGANVTLLDPSQDNPQLSGTIWKVRDGITTVNAGDVAAGTAASGSAFEYVFASKSCLNGYSAKVISVDDNRNVKIEIHNHYIRYLGLYIRYLDADGNPIPVSQLPPDTLDKFPDWAKEYNTEYDNMAMMINPEWSILGIPFKSDKQTFTFNVPEAASGVLVLAGGLGRGSDAFPKEVHIPGLAGTSFVDLAIPGVFLAAMAATGYAEFIKGSTTALIVKNVLTIAGSTVFAGITAIDYHDPKALIKAASTWGLVLLSVAGKPLVAKVQAYITGAEVTDQIPVLGMILQGIAAAGQIASIAETVAEVCRSPWVYDYNLSFTHQIHVTIKYDPKDYEFPATATHYKLKAIFDGGTPHVSGRINMPGNPWSDPLHYTFSNNVPYGGKVTISVGFYSENQWLSGQGSTGNIDNDKTAADVTITIKENKVPLRIDTVYGHEAKTVLDADGNLLWEASEAPTATRADLNCGNLNGDLCELASMTVSQHFAAAGYSWRSYSTGVTPCDSGGHAQLSQFAGMSIAQDPFKGHETSGCGFFNMVGIVYDLMGSQNNNFYLDSTGETHLARQIRLAMDQKPDFDRPDSNKCWGAFNAPSDAFLLHPARKLISVNSEYDKIEVLDLPDSAVPDEEAPLALVYSATGTREGLISGPICGAVAPDGAILILESQNRRIQAFDLGGNPAKHFGSKQDEYYVPLKEETSPVTYLDMAVEYVGYIYVLSHITDQGLYQYRLDIYTPEGDWLCRTTGVNAAKLDVDFWRNAFTLNYERLTYPDGTLPTVTEPSVSKWIPSTP